MTLIEFFDRVPIDNIMGTLLLRPEHVVFVGCSHGQMNKQKLLYEQVLKARGIKTEIVLEYVNRNDLGETVQAFERLVTLYDDCVFDLEGGEEIYLVAVGMIMERYKNVRIQRINLETCKILDLNSQTKDPVIEGQDLSLSEYLTISGGSIVYERNEKSYTYDWNLNEAMITRIHTLWGICKDDIGAWNCTVNTLDKVGDECNLKDSLQWSFSPKNAQQTLDFKGDKYLLRRSLMQKLASQGYLQDLVMTDETVSFRFRDEIAKRILTTAGQILELWVARCLMALTDPRNRSKGVFHDVRVGVHIDWNQEDDQDKNQSVNEIDVIAMKKNAPVFISCKNGSFTVDELYKLHTVAHRFGGEHAIQILVASSLNENTQNGMYMIKRARDMGIRIIKNTDVLSFENLKHELGTI